MKKKGLSVLAAAVLSLATAAFALGQTTTTTQVTKTVQNPDGTYTVIEYPAKKEVTINLTPIAITGAKGVATILRDDDGTKIKLSLTNVPTEVTALNLYAVDDTGAVTAIGPVTITNGTGSLMASTKLTKFMLIASPETTLTAYDPNTAVLFRSAVPDGFAVIPITAPRGEKVAAVTAPVVTPTSPTVVTPANPTVVTPANPTVVTPANPTVVTPANPTVVTPANPTVVTPANPTVVVTPANPMVVKPEAAAVVTAAPTYSVPMLNIPAYKKGDDTKIKVDFSGAMTGSRANVFITPRKDGPTEVRIRFHDLKDSPADQKFILWAVSPDNKFVKLGQVVNTPGRNEAEIKSETTLKDFGLVVTMESADGESPSGPIVGAIHIVP